MKNKYTAEHTLMDEVAENFDFEKHTIPDLLDAVWRAAQKKKREIGEVGKGFNDLAPQERSARLAWNRVCVRIAKLTEGQMAARHKVLQRMIDNALLEAGSLFKL